MCLPAALSQNAAVLEPCFSLLLSGSLSSQKALEVQRLLGFQLTDQALHGLGTNQKMSPLLAIAALSLATLACQALMLNRLASSTDNMGAWGQACA